MPALTWLKSLFESERRSEPRRKLSGIVAHYWDGESVLGREVLDISPGGAYLRTQERWYPDTVLRINLEWRIQPQGGCPDSRKNQRPGCMCVLGKVVRAGPDGIGVQFIFPGEDDPFLQNRYPECASNRKLLGDFLTDLGKRRGTLVFSIL